MRRSRRERIRRNPVTLLCGQDEIWSGVHTGDTPRYICLHMFRYYEHPRSVDRAMERAIPSVRARLNQPRGERIIEDGGGEVRGGGALRAVSRTLRKIAFMGLSARLGAHGC